MTSKNNVLKSQLKNTRFNSKIKREFKITDN